MGDEKISKLDIEEAKELSALTQRVFNLEKRVDENDRITTGIHTLAANMVNLTTEVKSLGEKLENGLREQGKRIGAVELAVSGMSNVKESIGKANKRLDAIEKEPADNWKKLLWIGVSVFATAFFGAIAAKLTGMI